MGTAYNDQWVLKRVAAETSMEPGVETARRNTARGLEGSNVSSSSTWSPVRGGMHRKPRGLTSKQRKSI